MGIRSDNTKRKSAAAGKKALVCCMDCAYSRLIQYSNNPIVADCICKPQPGNDKFPYVREVARPLRQCDDHRHTDEVKNVECRVA